MAEAAKLLYVVVVDESEGARGDPLASSPSFRYTRPVLQSTLQLMACKDRHAFKISQRVYDVLRRKCLALERPSFEESYHSQDACLGQEEVANLSTQETNKARTKIPFELYKRLTTVVIKREFFLNVVCDALAEYKYVGPNQRADLMLACRIRERKESVTILLCGTSGCGKSTLSSLLGSRLGITTVISTDSIRDMMRSFVDEKQNPLLWASTYHAGECLDPEAVAEAKAKRKAKKLSGFSQSIMKEDLSDGALDRNQDKKSLDIGSGFELIGRKQMAIEGFKAQSEMVIDSLNRLIAAWEERKESVIVEGMGLMKRHPSIIPFMIYIANEDKHMERFAMRAKYMTLDPTKNKYVKYVRNIRTIQEYLCNRADKHLVPKINNTNVDRSVAAIHATVFGCLRWRDAGEQLYDPSTNTVSIIDEEYCSQCAANSLSSKGMFKLIQRLGSSRHLVALINTDGSVAKAWPIGSTDGRGQSTSGDGSKKCTEGPLYGPLEIGRAESVNLQFGHFGLSAWPSDTVGTSHTGSVDDSKVEGTDNGSRNLSSCCCSPRVSDGPAKEMDGSVDEESTKSDEEYEDLTMQDDLENGYCQDDDEEVARKDDDDEEPNNQKKPTAVSSNAGDILTERYEQNLNLSKTTSRSSVSKRYQKVANLKKLSLSDPSRLHSQPQSVSYLGRSKSLPWGPTPTPSAAQPSLVE